MLHDFLTQNRSELIERCRAKVALRAAPRPTPAEMDHGIPLFLEQLIETLRIELAAAVPEAAMDTDAAAAAPRNMHTELAAGAAAHGHELLQQGFTVDQVVHDYGDLCQAVTELAVERKAWVSAEEFHTLNRCLDDAIAGAVTEYGVQRDRITALDGSRAMSEKLGMLAHEIRNLLNTATLAFAVMKNGSVGTGGATGAVLDRSLAGLAVITDRALAEVRLTAGMFPGLEHIPLASFIAEVQLGAGLCAQAKGCQLTVEPVEPGIEIHGDRQLLHSAAYNLLQNAFKFTQPCSHVTLRARSTSGRVLIEVEDQCGGLPPGAEEEMFGAFRQHGADRSGVGLGLSISRRAVEANGGKLRVRDMPGSGCVFTIDLPSHAAVA
jgi:signal transduction histidine kinase